MNKKRIISCDSDWKCQNPNSFRMSPVVEKNPVCVDPVVFWWHEADNLNKLMLLQCSGCHSPWHLCWFDYLIAQTAASVTCRCFSSLQPSQLFNSCLRVSLTHCVWYLKERLLLFAICTCPVIVWGFFAGWQFLHTTQLFLSLQHVCCKLNLLSAQRTFFIGIFCRTSLESHCEHTKKKHNLMSWYFMENFLHKIMNLQRKSLKSGHFNKNKVAVRKMSKGCRT